MSSGLKKGCFRNIIFILMSHFIFWRVCWQFLDAMIIIRLVHLVIDHPFGFFEEKRGWSFLRRTVHVKMVLVKMVQWRRFSEDGPSEDGSVNIVLAKLPSDNVPVKKVQWVCQPTLSGESSIGECSVNIVLAKLVSEDGPCEDGSVKMVPKSSFGECQYESSLYYHLYILI